MWKWISKSLSRPTEKPAAKADSPVNGKVKLDGNRLRVINPDRGGRFATLVPSPGVIIRLGGEVLTSPSPVSEDDDIQWELAPTSEQPFFRVELSDNRMTASIEIVSDPVWFADSVVVHPLPEGEVALMPAVVKKTRRRPKLPAEELYDGLKAAGVIFGIDNEAITQLVRKAEGGWRGSEVVARGQEGQAPVPDRWEWAKLQGLTSSGQVVARYHKGTPNLPMLTVIGLEQKVFEDAPSPRVELGPGMRLLPSGEVVATRRGLMRVTERPGHHVFADVLDTQVVDHPMPGATLQSDGDLAISGDATRVKIRAGGAVLITGKATECEITATSIEIAGRAEGCKLYTIPAADAGPLTGFLRIFQRQIADLAANPPDYITPFRKAQALLRYASDMLRGLPPFEQPLKDLMISITRVLMAGPDGSPAPRMAQLAAEIDQFCEEREQRAGLRGSITLGDGAAGCEAWAGGRIVIQGSGTHACQFFAVKDIVGEEGAVIAQSELMSARQVIINGSTAKKRPVTIRAGGRVTIGEAGEGTVVEIGGQTHHFKKETVRVAVGLTAKLELGVRLE